MAVESPPAFTQANTFGAEQTRRTIASLLQRGASIGSVAGGLVSATDCQLTPPGSGMTVNVGPGEIWVPGSSAATQSGYYCRVSSSTSLAIATSSPSNPRIDTVVAQVQDAAYSGATNSFQVAVVTGTATASATLVNLLGAGAVPASSLVLGYVLVPTSSTNVTGGNIANVAGRVLPSSALQATTVSANTTAVAGQLIIPTASCTVTLPTAPPTSSQVGVVVNYAATGASAVTINRGGSATIYGVGLSATTTFILGVAGAHVLLQFDGTNWGIISGQQDTGWVALTRGTNVGTLAGYYVPAARVLGDRVWLRGAMQTSGIISPGATIFTSPAAPASNVGAQIAYQGAGGGPAPIEIAASTGVATTLGATLSSGQTFSVDGISYAVS